MGELKRSILRHQLQVEVDAAREQERNGRLDRAGLHYMRAAAIYRRMAHGMPGRTGAPLFHAAEQYEVVVRNIRRKGARTARQMEPGELERMIDGMIITEKPDVGWEDIGGLKEAKREIQEAVILPFIKSRPGYVNAPRTILLYGPPGTGKTMLAKASCHSLEATFFEARASSLLSKYFGESGRLVSALFSKARKAQPSLVFMDEIDSLAMSRDSEVSEGSRRVLAQLLTEIEGFNTKGTDKVIIMAATNKPWDLDDAMLSRFQKRIYIPLPDEPARARIFEVHLKGARIEGTSALALARQSVGFSGREIAGVCTEAIMAMVREQNPGIHDLSSSQLERYVLRERPLAGEDFGRAMDRIRPSLKASVAERYEKWRDEFGG
jgi:katanin p60 ATPase-containing subunit A1